MVTPRDLALELRVSQKRIRDVLRDLYGALPADETRWELDDERASAVRSRFGKSRGESPEWALEVGESIRRREVHAAYGGQRQGGISTPTSIPDILIFTDPKSGARYGYDKFEGLREDGSYWYTGEGQYGPQTFIRGNAALRDAASKGRTIRLFTTAGTIATYVGAFTTGEPTYRMEVIPDLDGNARMGIIFNLVPIAADETLLPTFGGVRLASATERAWEPPVFTDVVVQIDEPAPTSERVVSRAEFQLQAAFGEWLRSGGDEPARLSLPVGNAVIEPDMYVPSRGWIVEAKKSIGRAYVRTAIGQVLDYVHIARSHGFDGRPVILLPGPLDDDLATLLANLGIALAFPTDDGFTIVPPPS